MKKLFNKNRDNDEDLESSRNLQSPISNTAAISSTQYSLLPENIQALDQLVDNYTYAVECNAVERNFDGGKFKVLEQLDMHIPEGAIYGLLGPSGCGKTTLLKCLLGRYDIHGGIINVFGAPPGEVNHPVPGPAVGYMPQELALEGEFAIHELLRYYSKLYGMSSDEYEKRKDFLLDFLDMPDQNKLVRECSGGQKRRISLCVALLHSPKLLILDEPTVGVDPKLRARIWKYLVDVSKNGTTIIITTHYVEEARQADMVGLMRNGRLLAEGPPDDLMVKYEQKTLEDTFLHLCMSDDDQLKERKEIEHIKPYNPPKPTLLRAGLKRAKVGALVWRNLQRMRRNVGFLVFQFFLPSIQVILFCLAIGKNPTHLKLCFINDDSSYKNFSIGAQLEIQLNQGNSYDLIYHQTPEEAINLVKHGKSWGLVHVPAKFTEKVDKMEFPIDTPVTIKLDMTNQQISLFIIDSIQTAFETILQNSDVGKLFQPLIQVDTPIYGERNPKFTDFIAPGMIIAISFAQAIGLTAVGLVLDKQAGIIDRTWSTGVVPGELLLSQVCTQFFVLLIQILLLLFFALIIFELPMHGSFFLLIALAMCLGMAGMVYGLLIAAGVEDAQVANQLALGSFFPMLLLSGIIWPLEGMPIVLRYISYAFPTTWSAEALRSIMARGWGIEVSNVWEGFVVTCSWTVLLFMISAFGVSSRRK